MVSPEPVDLGRLRLDTAEVEGLSMSASWNDGNNLGLALRFQRALGDVETAAAVGYRDDSHWRREPHRDYSWGFSMAGRHRPSGLNAAFGYGRSVLKDDVAVDPQVRSGDDYYYYSISLKDADVAEHWHIALGWDADLTDLGATAFLAVYGEKENSFYNDDRTRYWKLAVEQHFPRGFAVFASYARYDYDAVHHQEHPRAGRGAGRFYRHRPDVVRPVGGGRSGRSRRGHPNGEACSVARQTVARGRIGDNDDVADEGNVG